MTNALMPSFPVGSSVIDSIGVLGSIEYHWEGVHRYNGNKTDDMASTVK